MPLLFPSNKWGSEVWSHKWLFTSLKSHRKYEVEPGFKPGQYGCWVLFWLPLVKVQIQKRLALETPCQRFSWNNSPRVNFMCKLTTRMLKNITGHKMHSHEREYFCFHFFSLNYSCCFILGHNSSILAD